MTDTPDIVERCAMWVVRKGGYFYRPNAQGYTEFLFDAGVWPEDEAVKHNNDDPFGPVKAFPYSEWEAKISAGSPDEFISNQADTIAALRAEVEREKVVNEALSASRKTAWIATDKAEAERDAAIARAGKVTRSQFETIQSIVNYHTDIHDDNVLVDTARDIIEALGLEVEE